MIRPVAPLAAAVGVCALILAVSQDADAYPEPAVVSPSWSLDLTIGEPQSIAVKDYDGIIRWYWFVPYKALNNTGEDRLFIPEITVATNTGDILITGQNVPPSVFNAVKEQLNNPLLESPIEVVGKILQGQDYARESVAIWPAFQGDVDSFTLFFTGASGENATAVNPLTGEEILMRRTRMIPFQTPGNHATPETQPVIRGTESDVMR